MRSEFYFSVAAAWAGILIIALLIMVPISFVSFLYRIHKITKLLRALVWDLVREMEMNTPDGFRNRATIAENTAERFAVRGSATAGRALINPDKPVGSLTEISQFLIEKQADEGLKFKRERNDARRAISIFILMLDHNIEGARIKLKSMESRRDDIPSFGLLERLLEEKYSSLYLALSRKGRIFSGMEYNTDAEDGSNMVFNGTTIIPAMRTYLHTSKTYIAAR